MSHGRHGGHSQCIMKCRALFGKGIGRERDGGGRSRAGAINATGWALGLNIPQSPFFQEFYGLLGGGEEENGSVLGGVERDQGCWRTRQDVEVVGAKVVCESLCCGQDRQERVGSGRLSRKGAADVGLALWSLQCGVVAFGLHIRSAENSEWGPCQRCFEQGPCHACRRYQPYPATLPAALRF